MRISTRILISLALLLTLASMAFAGAMFFSQNAIASGLALQDSFGAGGTGGLNFGNTSTPYNAAQFIPASSYTITQIGEGIKGTVGSPYTSAVTAYIYSDVAGTPGIALCTSSATEQPTLTASFANYNWPFAGCAVTSGTTYWLVLNKVADASNVGQTQSASGGALLTKYSSDGVSWTAGASSRTPTIQTYITH